MYQVRDLVHFCDGIVYQSMNDEEFYGLILCGDFNLPLISSPIAYLKWKMIHCVCGPTFPSKTNLQIDHIFLHKQLKLS